MTLDPERNLISFHLCNKSAANARIALYAVVSSIDIRSSAVILLINNLLHSFLSLSNVEVP